MNISVKPQTVSPKFQGTVRQLFQMKIRDALLHPQFQTDVIKPLNIEEVFDQEIQNISGGKLQRVAIILALGKPADVYLPDEPPAFLDSERRLAASKVTHLATAPRPPHLAADDVRGPVENGAPPGVHGSALPWV